MIDQSNPESRSRFGMYLTPMPQASVSYERLPPTRSSVRNTTLVAAAQAGWPAADPRGDPVRHCEGDPRNQVIRVGVRRGPVRSRVVVVAQGEVAFQVRVLRVEPVGVRVAFDGVVEDVVGPSAARMQIETVDAAVGQLAFVRLLGGPRLGAAHPSVQTQPARHVQALQVVLCFAIGGVQLRRPAQRSFRVCEPAPRLLRPADVLPAVRGLAGDGHLGLVGLERGLVVASIAQRVRPRADLLGYPRPEPGRGVDRRARGSGHLCAGTVGRPRVRQCGKCQAAGDQCRIQAHRPFLQASSKASSTSRADSTLAPSRAFTSSTAGLPSLPNRMSMSMGPSRPSERTARTPSSATSGRSTRSTPNAFPTRPSLRPVLRSTTAAGTRPSRSTKRFRSYSSPGRNSCQTTSSGLAQARSSAPRWTTTPRPPRPKRGLESSGNPRASASSSCEVAEA